MAVLPERRVDSLDGFLQQVLALPLSKEDQEVVWLYRGQRKAAWYPPVTKVDRDEFVRIRTHRGWDRALHERHLLKDFKKAARLNLPVPPENDWEWLAVGQHYGLATRLLDWTRNPWAGLFFAVERPAEDADNPEDSAVLCYGHTGKSWTSYPEGPFTICEIVAFFPPHVSPRIPAQSACFTVHPSCGDPGNPDWKGDVLKLVIPGQARGPLRRALLDRFHVSRASLFPELDGAGDYSNRLYSVLGDEQP